MAGRLFIVATPIGNLKDITLRALEVLAAVDFIAAEDTRRTQKLLNHYEIKTKTVSFHEYSEEKRRAAILDALLEGKTVALVSDAGTPLISDPGFMLVRECAGRGIEVESLPGPCAAVSAVALSGLDCRSFTFAGFLPNKDAARKKELERLRDAGLPFVLYEAPGRVLKTLAAIGEALGKDAPVSVSRELTKVYEETMRGTAAEALGHFVARPSVKGEFCIVVGAAPRRGAGEEEIRAMLEECIAGGMTNKAAVTHVTAALGCPKNKVYQTLLRITGA